MLKIPDRDSRANLECNTTIDWYESNPAPSLKKELPVAGVGLEYRRSKKFWVDIKVAVRN